MKTIVIFGADSHSKVLIDIIENLVDYNLVVLIDNSIKINYLWDIIIPPPLPPKYKNQIKLIDSIF